MAATGQKGPDVFNATGQHARDRTCNVTQADGSSYLFGEINEFWRHPIDPDACTMRTLSYSDGLVSTDLADCTKDASPMYDEKVVESVGTHKAQGEDRCVVRIKSGLKPEAYKAFEERLRDQATIRSDVYQTYKKIVDAVRAEVEALKLRRDDLKAAVKKERAEIARLRQSIAVEQANKASWEAKTRAIHIGALRERLRTLHAQLE